MIPGRAFPVGRAYGGLADMGAGAEGLEAELGCLL